MMSNIEMKVILAFITAFSSLVEGESSRGTTFVLLGKSSRATIMLASGGGLLSLS